ncbi:YbbR-like protein [Candidatus Magnetoovum chiemensis]|nr:YbbR-like protein [Candidatus Magnetoovum chiemensis]
MKSLFLKNKKLKVFSLFLSIFLWFYVTMKGQSEIVIEKTIEYKNIPKSYEIINTSTNVVTINIQGPENTIQTLNSKDIRVYLDLAESKEGENIYYLNDTNVKIPTSLTFNKVNPSYIIVNIDKTEVKTVTVKPVLAGKPRYGYEIRKVDVSPPTVSVEGTRQALKDIRDMETLPIDVNELDSDIEQYATLDYKEKGITDRNEKVKVTISISGHSKTVDVKPIIKGKPKAGYKVREVYVFPSKISIEGPKKIVDKTSYVETEPVDVDGADANMELYVSIDYKDKDLKNKNDKVKVKIVISGENS